ncbi:hypothetical protein C8J57DRAFT_1719177 [Mycena rebaudengoi]|nr:hypothetical protein C8J57DRAFT_1719177 [Mycena rebaudengoi]
MLDLANFTISFAPVAVNGSANGASSMDVDYEPMDCAATDFVMEDVPSATYYPQYNQAEFDFASAPTPRSRFRPSELTAPIDEYSVQNQTSRWSTYRQPAAERDPVSEPRPLDLSGLIFKPAEQVPRNQRFVAQNQSSPWDQMQRQPDYLESLATRPNALYNSPENWSSSSMLPQPLASVTHHWPSIFDVLPCPTPSVQPAQYNVPHVELPLAVYQLDFLRSVFAQERVPAPPRRQAKPHYSRPMLFGEGAAKGKRRRRQPDKIRIIPYSTEVQVERSSIGLVPEGQALNKRPHTDKPTRAPANPRSKPPSPTGSHFSSATSDSSSSSRSSAASSCLNGPPSISARLRRMEEHHQCIEPASGLVQTVWDTIAKYLWPTA